MKCIPQWDVCITGRLKNVHITTTVYATVNSNTYVSEKSKMLIREKLCIGEHSQHNSNIIGDKMRVLTQKVKV